MKTIAIYGLLALGCLGHGPFLLRANSAPEVVPVDAKKAAKLLKQDSGVIVLDIRTPEEFKTGHIAGAKNIDFNAKDFVPQLASLDKSKTYLVHCRSGRRSSKSLGTFNTLHFKSVYHLEGGIKDWVKNGFPLTTD